MTKMDLPIAFADDEARKTYGPGKKVNVPEHLVEGIREVLDIKGDATPGEPAGDNPAPQDDPDTTGPVDPNRDPSFTLTGLFGPEIGSKLAAEGYQTGEEVAQASDQELTTIEGIGGGKLGKIREVVGAGETEEDEEDEEEE